MGYGVMSPVLMDSGSRRNANEATGLEWSANWRAAAPKPVRSTCFNSVLSWRCASVPFTLGSAKVVEPGSAKFSHKLFEIL
jgi:hypothetical protein